jgi:hypothetical protein
LSSLTDDSWRHELADHFDKPSFRRLAAFVVAEQQSKQHVIYPPPAAIWTALNLCPLAQVKVVIVGQDPYHGPGQAHGLAYVRLFSFYYACSCHASPRVSLTHTRTLTSYSTPMHFLLTVFPSDPTTSPCRPPCATCTRNWARTKGSYRGRPTDTSCAGHARACSFSILS